METETHIVKIDAYGTISRLPAKLPSGVTGIDFLSDTYPVVFYRSKDGLVGFVADDSSVKLAVRKLEIKRPAGLCCDPWGLCLLQFSSEMLWGFDSEYQLGRRLCGAGLFKTVSSMFPEERSSSEPYGICRTAQDSVVVSLPAKNRVVLFNKGLVGWQLGSGRPGFASSASPKAMAFNRPSGVCFDQGSQMMFVADSGNSVVRGFQNKEERMFVGTPGRTGEADGVGPAARLSNPTRIKSKNGKVCFVDGNLVKVFSIGDLVVSTLYSSSKVVVDVAFGGDAVYILESIP